MSIFATRVSGTDAAQRGTGWTDVAEMQGAIELSNASNWGRPASAHGSGRASAASL
jgi:hypothetical protein